MSNPFERCNSLQNAPESNNPEDLTIQGLSISLENCFGFVQSDKKTLNHEHNTPKKKIRTTNQNSLNKKKQITFFNQPTSTVTFSDFSVKPVLGDDKIKKSCMKGSNSPLKSPKFNYEKSKKLSKSVISKESKSGLNQNLSHQEADPIVYFSNYYNKKSFKDLIPNEKDQFSPERSSNSKLKGFVAEKNENIEKENAKNEDTNKKTKDKEYVSSNLTLLPKSSFISNLKLRKSFSKFHHEKILSISESLQNKNNKKTKIQQGKL